MEKTSKPLEKFFTDYFKVILKPQSYFNILYLLFSFPLGIFYFVFLVTGISVGLGTIVIFVGIPILLFMLIISKRFMSYERIMVTNYLHLEVPGYNPKASSNIGLFRKIKDEITDPVSWKSFIFLLLKFPLGIFNFTVVVTLFSVSLGLLFAPIAYISVGQGTGVDIFGHDLLSLIAVNMPSGTKSVIYSVIGFIFVFGSMYLTNLLTYLNARILSLMYEKW